MNFESPRKPWENPSVTPSSVSVSSPNASNPFHSSSGNLIHQNPLNTTTSNFTPSSVPPAPAANLTPHQDYVSGTFSPYPTLDGVAMRPDHHMGLQGQFMAQDPSMNARYIDRNFPDYGMRPNFHSPLPLFNGFPTMSGFMDNSLYGRGDFSSRLGDSRIFNFLTDVKFSLEALDRVIQLFAHIVDDSYRLWRFSESFLQYCLPKWNTAMQATKHLVFGNPENSQVDERKRILQLAASGSAIATVAYLLKLLVQYLFFSKQNRFRLTKKKIFYLIVSILFARMQMRRLTSVSPQLATSFSHPLAAGGRNHEV